MAIPPIPIWTRDLGRLSYAESFGLQKHLQEIQLAGQLHSGLLFVEHPAVITLSRSSNKDDVTAPEKVLASRGIALEQTDRGGQVTYHGPGQLVVYFLFNLKHFGEDLHAFLRNMEEAVILYLEAHQLKPYRSPGQTGVWVGKEKVCAMGIHVRRWWTTHGLALNVTTDLNHFGLIIPCGIRDRGVTSMEKLLAPNSCPTLEDAKSGLLSKIQSVFNVVTTPLPDADWQAIRTQHPEVS
jgi:lipoate-protein ligase B